MFRSRLAFILLLFATAGIRAGMPEIPADKAVIEFPSRLGTVTFAHKAHAGLKNVTCQTCHHTYPDKSPEIRSCRSCHTADAKDAPTTREVFHLRCRGCHEYTVESGDKAGPLKCKLCHVKASE